IECYITISFVNDSSYIETGTRVNNEEENEVWNEALANLEEWIGDRDNWNDIKECLNSHKYEGCPRGGTGDRYLSWNNMDPWSREFIYRIDGACIQINYFAEDRGIGNGDAFLSVMFWVITM
ncbi:MAG: hypothetical protein KBT30_00240, partial [Clostridiales bacterium]|nr:hypothetical protein [Candidatus Apopatousia equi]